MGLKLYSSDKVVFKEEKLKMTFRRNKEKGRLSGFEEEFDEL